MKLGVFAVLLGDKTLEEALRFFKAAGIQAVEIGCGGYPGKAHCDPARLLKDENAFVSFKAAIDQCGMEISALSIHGNPVHPDKDIAAKYHADFEQAVLLAERLGLNRIVTFSGCPGGAPGDHSPNWITCPWPDDFSEALDYQWNKVLIPYWEKAAAFANAHGVTRIALEMHPGFCVYNPETLLKLRKAIGPVIGANFDPSHLFWQGIDPVAAIRYLGNAIYFFHAKDTKVDALNTARIGVLDTKRYADEINRAWVFRSVGYGHGADVWKDIVSNLRMVGYDDVLSIEHEDSLMSQNEGLTKAVAFLKDVMTFETRNAKA
jgi:sugar phosphate isomerase/epimerase